MGSRNDTKNALWDLQKCPPGAVLGGFWGGPRALLGGLGVVLERFFCQFDLRSIVDRFLIDFCADQGAQREAFGEAKWSQNRSKIEVEI